MSARNARDAYAHACVPYLNVVEEVNQQGSVTEAPQHRTSLTYLPNLQAALKSHIRSHHKQGYANSKSGFYSYYQSLLLNIHKGINNAFWSMSKLSLSPNEMQYLPLPQRHPFRSETRCQLYNVHQPSVSTLLASR